MRLSETHFIKKRDRRQWLNMHSAMVIVDTG